MWILHFLPDAAILWAVNLLLLAGIILAVAGLFAHRIPLIWQYQLPFKIVGIALLALGVYFRGGYGVEMTWRERVAEVEAQLEEAKKESAKVNTVVETRVVTKTKIIKEKGDVIVQQVDRVIPVEKDCAVPKEAIDLHNQAATLNRAAGGAK